MIVGMRNLQAFGSDGGELIRISDKVDMGIQVNGSNEAL